MLEEKHGITDLLGQFLFTCVMDRSAFLLLLKLPSLFWRVVVVSAFGCKAGVVT